MGKLVVTEFASLDGVIEDPGGAEAYEHGGWTFQFDQGDGPAFKFDELRAADAQLLGRVTYEAFAKAWPEMEGTGEFGEKFNAMPKHVVSTTLEDPTWNNTIVHRSLDEVAALKERYDGDILVAGSATLAQSLLAAELVDEVRLMVFPIALGTGKKLFADGMQATAFTLAEARHTGDVVILTLTRPTRSWRR